ncbi:MAG: hypothetical protein ACRED9_08765 [Caulobacteraceae bacterium]
MAMLSPAGAMMLKQSQMNWLSFIATVCPAQPITKWGGSPSECLKRNFEERLTELAMVGQRLGPFRFNRLDFFARRPDHDATGATSGFYTNHVGYPQIDDPTIPAARAWNTKMVRPLDLGGDCDGPDNDSDDDYVLGYANRNLISVRIEHSFYCHGTPHGLFGFTAANILYSQDGRALTASDVFGPGRGWVAPLQRLLMTAIAEKGWRAPNEQAQEGVEEEVVSPDHWLFSKEGLQVAFGAYEGGCYACNPGEPTVNWSALEPQLSPNAAVP